MWYRDYRCRNWTMFKDFGNNVQYGIDENKNWYSGEIENRKTDSEYLASNKEIEKALRKEAKRRGFVEGVKFLGCEGLQKDEELVVDDIRYKNFHNNCGLYNGASWIYRNGEWGEVVKNLDLRIPQYIYFYNDKVPIYWNDQTKVYEGETTTLNNGSTWSGNKVVWRDSGKILEQYSLKTYFYHKSEKHGANFYELIKEVQTKVGEEWKTFVIYKQLGSGLEFSREKEEFYKKFKQVYV